MKLEFNKFDINSFNTTEDFDSECVFVLEDYTFIQGGIICHEGIISMYYYDLICQEKYDCCDVNLPEPKFYMFTEDDSNEEN